MGSDEAFCLKWNDFQSGVSGSLGSLLQAGDLLDVTLQCGREGLQCHRLVLSACSDWFRSVFRALPTPTLNPVIVMWETAAQEMKLLLDFMYNGEVNVKQGSLNSFLALAERLSVRGLTQSGGGGGGGGPGEASKLKTPVPTKLREEEQVEEVEEVKTVVKQEAGTEQIYQQEQTSTAVTHYEEEEGYDESYYEEAGQEYQYNTHQENSQHYAMKAGSGRRSAQIGQAGQAVGLVSQALQGQQGGHCSLCGRDYVNIRQHIDDLHNPNKQPVNCTICGKRFASKNSMRVHKSTFHREPTLQ